MKRVKIGYIGVGEQGWSNLLPAIAQVKNVELNAVCDVNETQAKFAGQKYGAKNIFNDYKEMINHGEIEAVVMACPPQIHAEVAEYAISKNIHIFVEKPPTLYTEDLIRLAKLATQKNIITGVGLNFRYAEPHQLFTHIMNKDGFGDIAHIQVTHMCNKPKTPLWGLTSTLKSFLLAQAIHPIDMLLHLGGDVKKKSLSIEKNNGALLLALQLEFESGAIGNLLTGTMFPHFESSIEVISTKSKILKLDSLWHLHMFDSEKQSALLSETKRWTDIWTPSPLNSGHGRSGYAGEIQAFIDAIATNGVFSPSFNDQIPVYEVMDFIEDYKLNTVDHRKAVYAVQTA